MPYTEANRTADAPRRLAFLACLLLGLFLLEAGPAVSQGQVRAMGMGGAYTAAARGLDAVSWNPANLVISRESGLQLGLVSVAVDVHNNSFSLARYNEVTGATLTQADKQLLLDDIPAEGLILNADVHASALGFCSGSFALSIEGLGGGSGTLDKDFFDLILMGNEIGQDFSFDKTDGEAYAAAAATLSWATPLVTRRTHRLALGINARYLYGLYDFRVEEATGGIRADMTGVYGSADAAYLTSRGGRGWAVDMGLALQAPRGWTFGLAVDNTASAMKWTRDVERTAWHATADSLTVLGEDMEDLVTESDTTYAAAAYATTLPTVIRLGASNRWGNLAYAVDISRGLDQRSGQVAGTEYSTGLELRLASWFRPRLGLGYGGAAGRRAAAGLGLGLGPVHLDLAVANRGEWVPRDTRGLAFATGVGMEF